MNRNPSRWTAVATGVATIALAWLSFFSLGGGTGTGMAEKNGGTLTCCTK